MSLGIETRPLTFVRTWRQPLGNIRYGAPLTVIGAAAAAAAVLQLAEQNIAVSRLIYGRDGTGLCGGDSGRHYCS